MQRQDPATCVGIIANPVSARDIRRIVSNASNLQTSERVNIVLRLLTTLASMGVGRVLMMPDKCGLTALLLRSLRRERNSRHQYPEVEMVDMAPTSTVADTFLATRRMREAGVSAIIVLGGDGTHRAVVREMLQGEPCGDRPIPIAGLSTGTNNAFPEMREPTVTALAVGLYATGRLTAEQALAANKVLEISINGGERGDIAIVDAVIARDRFIGARALWKTESLHAAYLTFADPEVIGLSAIGGLLHPVGRNSPGGLAVHLADHPAAGRIRLKAPITPGLVSELGISAWEAMPANHPFAVPLEAGVVALDGEREMTFEAGEQVSITLRESAFSTVDVARCMQTAAHGRLFRHS